MHASFEDFLSKGEHQASQEQPGHTLVWLKYKMFIFPSSQQACRGNSKRSSYSTEYSASFGTRYYTDILE